VDPNPVFLVTADQVADPDPGVLMAKKLNFLDHKLQFTYI
jgi:hypothetical protein